MSAPLTSGALAFGTAFALALVLALAFALAVALAFDCAALGELTIKAASPHMATSPPTQAALAVMFIVSSGKRRGLSGLRRIDCWCRPFAYRSSCRAPPAKPCCGHGSPAPF